MQREEEEEEAGGLLDFAATFAQLCEDERTQEQQEQEEEEERQLTGCALSWWWGGRGDAEEEEGGGAEVVVRQDTGVGQGGAVWASALALVRWWRRQQQSDNAHPVGQRVRTRGEDAGEDSAVLALVELGAGTGAAGIALGALLGHTRVVLTDLPPYLPLLRHNIALNETLLELRGSCAEAATYCWGEPPPLVRTESGQNVTSYDVVVGSDLIYDAAKPGFDWRRNHQDLVASFDLLAHPAGSGKASMVVLAAERRHGSSQFYDAFFELLHERGWAYDVQPFSLDHRADVIIVTIRRATSITASCSALASHDKSG